MTTKSKSTVLYGDIKPDDVVRLHSDAFVVLGSRLYSTFYKEQQARQDVPYLVRHVDSSYIELIPLQGVDSAPEFVENRAAEFSYLSDVEIRDLHPFIARAKMQAIGTGYGPFIGCDPELFIVDANDTVIPAWEFLPAQGKGIRNQAAEFWDGFQAEFTPTPHSCHVELVHKVQRHISSLSTKARQHSDGAWLTYRSAVKVPLAMMQAASDEHVALGCAPSTNVYSGVRPLSVDNPRSLALRFAGCHMHFGVHLSPVERGRAIRMMDVLQGMLSVSLFQGMEDTRRRQFYGRAGEYRLPAHGLEYRTPSSACLANPPLFHLNFDLARFALALARHNIQPFVRGGDAEVQAIINDYDIKGAQRFIEANESALLSIFRRLSYYWNNGDRNEKKAQSKVLALLMEGAMQHMNIDNDVAQNWSVHIPFVSWLNRADK